MVEEQLSIEERREKLLEIGWVEVLPNIFINNPLKRVDERYFAHLCNKITNDNSYGGYLVEGRCEECNFRISRNIQFTLNLLEFKG